MIQGRFTEVGYASWRNLRVRLSLLQDELRLLSERTEWIDRHVLDVLIRSLEKDVFDCIEELERSFRGFKDEATRVPEVGGQDGVSGVL